MLLQYRALCYCVTKQPSWTVSLVPMVQYNVKWKQYCKITHYPTYIVYQDNCTIGTNPLRHNQCTQCFGQLFHIFADLFNCWCDGNTNILQHAKSPPFTYKNAQLHPPNKPKSGSPFVILSLEEWYCMEPYNAGPLEIVFATVLKRPVQNNTHIIAMK